MTKKEISAKIKDGLPREAFAIASHYGESDTWQLPHHGKSILRAIRGQLDIEQTIDWKQMDMAVAALLPKGFRRQRVEASPEAILEAARHLAEHYQKAGKPLPDILAAPRYESG